MTQALVRRTMSAITTEETAAHRLKGSIHMRAEREAISVKLNVINIVLAYTNSLVGNASPALTNTKPGN